MKFPDYSIRDYLLSSNFKKQSIGSSAVFIPYNNKIGIKIKPLSRVYNTESEIKRIKLAIKSKLHPQISDIQKFNLPTFNFIDNFIEGLYQESFMTFLVEMVKLGF